MPNYQMFQMSENRSIMYNDNITKQGPEKLYSLKSLKINHLPPEKKGMC